MGELIFVLVILVQGIAAVATAIKKKRDKAAALLAGEDPKAGKTESKAGRKLESAAAARDDVPVRAAQERPRQPGTQDPGPMSPTPDRARTAKPVARATGASALLDEKLARRREQLAQLRSIASKAMGQPTPPTSSSTTSTPTAALRSTTPPPPPTPGRGAARPTTARPTTPATRPAAPAAGGRVPQASIYAESLVTGGTTDGAPTTETTGSDFTPMQARRTTRKAAGGLRPAGGWLADRRQLRRAIVLKELLDPPVGLRPERDAF